MRNPIVYLHTLSKEDLGALTHVLSRRPDYGIARPSPKWLNRQEQKIEKLPKSLLRTKNVLQRLTISFAERIDERQKQKNEQQGQDQDDRDFLLPPSAILCESHKGFNPFLIRDIFLYLLNECAGDFSNALRLWAGKSPALAAMLTRIDSINALWMSREVFEATFGAAPHDDRFVRVHSNCEACILAAIGANGRILADLHAWLTVRREANKRFNQESKKRESRRRRHSPRLYRVVSAWIGHLKYDDADEVLRWSSQLTVDLRKVWEAIELVRDRQKKQWHKSHKEVRIDRDGSKQTVNEVQGRHLTRDGIPLPHADPEATVLQRNMASMHKNFDAMSVYRPDTLINGGESFSYQVVKNFRQLGSESKAKANANSHAGDQPRPGAPEPGRQSGVPSVERPRESFLNRFEREMPLPTGNDEEYDETNEQEANERDPAAEARSIEHVMDWYGKMAMNQTRTNLDDIDPREIHPAFQRQATAASAMPSPLRLGNNRASYTPPRAGWTGRQSVQSVWTDVSIYTTNDADDVDSAPPMPSIPAQYRHEASGSGDRTPTGTTAANSSGPREANTYAMPGGTHHRVSSSGHGVDVDRDDTFSSHDPTRAPRLDAYRRDPPPPPQTKDGRRKYLFKDDDSEVASRLTATNRKYLKAHRGFKDVPPENNPFVRKESVRRRHQEQSPTSPRSGTPRNEGYAALNREAEGRQHRAYVRDEYDDGPPTPRAAAAPGNGNHPQAAPGNAGTPINRRDLDAEEAEWRHRFKGADDVRPDDSASNVMWRKRGSDDITTLGHFLEQGGDGGRRR
ncbi:hypothetical protein JX266_011158 [Neoarthrinium moseri]|nr:hypothetical protein JX266_011158 [Neoarthrinium moseri]